MGCKTPILEVIKLASLGAKRKAKWCKTHPNVQIWTEQNGHKSTIQPLNVWFKTAIRARMERRKRVFCKIYLPNLDYPKKTPHKFPLTALLLTILLLTTLPLTSYYPTTSHATTYYLTPYYSTPYYSTTNHPTTFINRTEWMPQHAAFPSTMQASCWLLKS